MIWSIRYIQLLIGSYFNEEKKETEILKNTFLGHRLGVSRSVPLLPHAGKITDALSRIGYKIEEAVADLIDNSIDASASSALIRFVHDESEIKQIWIIDNGKGMDSNTLLAAMQFGSARDRSPGDLGKFGLGLKTAAFSQGRSVTVVSNQRGAVSACRWTIQTIASGWNCEILISSEAERLVRKMDLPFDLSKNGTVVLIDDLDHISTDAKGLEATLQKIQKKLSIHLGLVFHRFLDDGFKLFVDAYSIEAGEPGFIVPIASLNPFSYAVSGDKHYPLEFSVCLKGLPPLACQAHIWPPNQTTPGFLLSGKNVAKRQGFYFYRNGRLIQAGGWNGWKDNENDHHLSLARVAVEIPPIFDSEFRLNVQKSALDVPESFKAALGESSCPMARFVKRAEEIYRKKIEVEEVFIPVPGRGFGGLVRQKSAAYLAGKKTPKKEINVLWGNLDSDRFFVIDREAGNIILNTFFRKDVLNGDSASLNDVPLIKILLFMLLRDDLQRERESQRFMARLEEINELLMLAIREEKNRQCQ